MIRTFQPDVIPKTTSFTLDTSQVASGTQFTNRGAVGAVTITLPARSNIRAHRGYFVDFIGVADQNIAFTAGSAIAIALGSVAATSLTASTSSQKIGAVLRATWEGTAWVLTALQGTGTIA